MAAVAERADFPITLEAAGECLTQVLDVGGLEARLAEVAAGGIRVSRVTSSAPSPFAAEVAWQRTNNLMYEDDTPEGRGPDLAHSLAAQVGLASALRPELDPGLVEAFSHKLARTAPGYAPAEPVEWLEYLKERLVLSAAEWRAFLAAIERDCQVPADQIRAALGPRALALLPSDAKHEALVLAAEVLPHLAGWAPGSLSLDGTAGSDVALDAAAAVEAASEPEDEGLQDFLLEWLGRRGPVPVARLEAMFAGDGPGIAEALDALVARERVVVDRLTRGTLMPQACALSNLERLLRMARAAARPGFSARPAADLPAFLAAWQGLGRGVEEADGVVGLQAALEPLFGWCAKAGAWETELLPARLRPYRPAWLDALFADSDLGWLGCHQQRLILCLGAERDLFALESHPDDAPLSGPAAQALAAFPGGPGRFSLADLSRASGQSTAELTAGLWELAWQGRVSADGFSSVRRGIATRFKAADEPARPARTGRSGASRRAFARWKAERPLAGTWFLLQGADEPADALDQEQLRRERIRLLVDRYGLVFRELLARELPVLRWGTLFRSLLMMELSGEIVAGHFIDGVAGLQFASPKAIEALARGPDPDRLFWLNAADPASACGLGVEGLDLPRRLATTHLVYLGADLVCISERSGKALTFRLPPDHPRLPELLTFLTVQLSRAASPRRAVTVETINDLPAAQSGYRQILAERFVCEAAGPSLRLTRRYG